MLSRGVLVTVEGIDGSGKSTLVTNLSNSLKKLAVPIVVTKEPGGTALGKQLREILQHQTTPLTPIAEYLLFAADRAQHFHDLVVPHLRNNYLVLSDRMADSSVAYQGFGRGLDCTILHTINTWAMQQIKPDLTIYVRITPEVALQRLHARGKLTTFEQEKEDFTRRLAHGFDTMFAQRSDVVILDGMLTPEQLTQLATDAITKKALNRP